MRDVIFEKSTQSAAKYLKDLYGIFNSWYLAAAAYNMGETRLQGFIQKYKTNNFWALSEKKDFPRETKNYIPKLLAVLLIAKSPRIYGFTDIQPQSPHSYENIWLQGGTDLKKLSKSLGVSFKNFKKLNPAVLEDFIPGYVTQFKVRIPKGLKRKAHLHLAQISRQ